MEYFTKEEKLMLLEGNLVNTLLAEGLDCLRKANLYNQGLYYQAFYSLSIGIERLLKLILIEEYRINNENKFPENNYLKKRGHNLEKMIEEISPEILKDPLNKKIISFLSHFNTTTRYYNLDILTNKELSDINPLKEWNIITKEILNQHSPNSNKITNKQLLTNLLNQTMDTLIINTNETEITSSRELLTEIENRDTIQRESVLICFKIIRNLITKLTTIEKENDLFPYLWEIFRNFRGTFSNSEIKNKKNWRSFITN